MHGSDIHLRMATAEPWTPSRRMKAAATTKRVRVERELSRLSAREEALAHELEQARRAQSTLQDELRVLERLSHNLTEEDVASAPAGARRLRVVPDGPSVAEKERNIVLRGAPIRETAVRVLIAATESDQAVHYRTWYDSCVKKASSPPGKDPLATFLTQIGRSPVVRRSTAPGMYSVDLDAPTRIRARLERLQTELREVDAFPPKGVHEIERGREVRASLEAEVASVTKPWRRRSGR